jgi:hypothetical protein
MQLREAGDMNCANCGAELSLGFDYCPQCGSRQERETDTGGGSHASGGAINTGGGVYIAGGSQIEGGTFVAHDQHVAHDFNQTSQHGLQGADLARLTDLFQAVYQQVQVHTAADPDADADLLQGTVKKIEDEAAKGDAADEGSIRKWLHTLAGLAPDVLEVVVNALTNPGAAVASGVKLVAHAFRRKAGNPATS